jgi:response regulator NasT
MMGKRILLVDDDSLVLAGLALGLKGEGYQVTTAGDGGQALAAVAEADYDLAVVDIRMPDMSGIELAARFRHEGGPPVMFLSAFSDKEAVSAALAEGGLGYVVKPVDIVQLVPAIEAALARARDLRALLDITEQLHQALAGGRNTSTAIGVLMERHSLGQEAAFNRLRTAARSRGCKVEALAARLVEASDLLNSLVAPEKPVKGG